VTLGRLTTLDSRVRGNDDCHRVGGKVESDLRIRLSLLADTHRPRQRADFQSATAAASVAVFLIAMNSKNRH